MDFKGKTAFVTGAAKGIGRATAIGFAKGGANLILADIADKIELRFTMKYATIKKSERSNAI